MDAFITFLGYLPRMKGGGRCCAEWHVAKQLAEWGAGSLVCQSNICCGPHALGLAVGKRCYYQGGVALHMEVGTFFSTI